MESNADKRADNGFQLPNTSIPPPFSSLLGREQSAMVPNLASPNVPVMRFPFPPPVNHWQHQLDSHGTTSWFPGAHQVYYQGSQFINPVIQTSHDHVPAPLENQLYKNYLGIRHESQDFSRPPPTRPEHALHLRDGMPLIRIDHRYEQRPMSTLRLRLEDVQPVGGQPPSRRNFIKDLEPADASRFQEVKPADGKPENHQPVLTRVLGKADNDDQQPLSTLSGHKIDVQLPARMTLDYGWDAAYPDGAPLDAKALRYQQEKSETLSTLSSERKRTQEVAEVPLHQKEESETLMRKGVLESYDSALPRRSQDEELPPNRHFPGYWHGREQDRTQDVAAGADQREKSESYRRRPILETSDFEFEEPLSTLAHSHQNVPFYLRRPLSKNLDAVGWEKIQEGGAAIYQRQITETLPRRRVLDKKDFENDQRFSLPRSHPQDLQCASSIHFRKDVDAGDSTVRKEPASSSRCQQETIRERRSDYTNHEDTNELTMPSPQTCAGSCAMRHSCKQDKNREALQDDRPLPCSQLLQQPGPKYYSKFGERVETDQGENSYHRFSKAPRVSQKKPTSLSATCWYDDVSKPHPNNQPRKAPVVLPCPSSSDDEAEKDFQQSKKRAQKRRLSLKRENEYEDVDDPPPVARRGPGRPRKDGQPPRQRISKDPEFSLENETDETLTEDNQGCGTYQSINEPENDIIICENSDDEKEKETSGATSSLNLKSSLESVDDTLIIISDNETEHSNPSTSSHRPLKEFSFRAAATASWLQDFECSHCLVMVDEILPPGTLKTCEPHSELIHYSCLKECVMKFGKCPQCNRDAQVSDIM